MIVITGGAGFIGSTFAKTFIGEDLIIMIHLMILSKKFI